jgi:hypothetical protein
MGGMDATAREMGRTVGRKATTPAARASLIEDGKRNIATGGMMKPFLRNFYKAAEESFAFDGAQPTNTKESKRATALGRSPVVRTTGTTVNKELLGE